MLDVDTLSYFKAPGEDRLGAFELLLTEAKAPNEEIKAGGKQYLQLVTVDAMCVGIGDVCVCVCIESEADAVAQLWAGVRGRRRQHRRVADVDR